MRRKLALMLGDISYSLNQLVNRCINSRRERAIHWLFTDEEIRELGEEYQGHQAMASLEQRVVWKRFRGLCGRSWRITYLRRRRSAAMPSSAVPSRVSVLGSGVLTVSVKTYGSIEGLTGLLLGSRSWKPGVPGVPLKLR
jgi:hypothetical protein